MKVRGFLYLHPCHITIIRFILPGTNLPPSLWEVVSRYAARLSQSERLWKKPNRRGSDIAIENDGRWTVGPNTYILGALIATGPRRPGFRIFIVFSNYVPTVKTKATLNYCYSHQLET